MLSLRACPTYVEMRLISVWVLLTACLASTGACLAQPVLAPADPRDGYERADYETATAALDMSTGKRLDLVARAASPPLGLPALANLPSAAEVDLGRALFFDRRLSANATLSCGMCHVPEQGFAQQ